MPVPPRPQQRICVKADTRGDVGASHEELDSLIKPPPPLEVPLDQEVVHHDTHLSHPAHPHLPCVPPAAPTCNGGSTTQAKVLLESFLASTRPSSVDLQLSRQLFQDNSQAAPLPVATVNTPANHVFGSTICSRVQHKIQDILMQHNLESYSQPQSIDGRIFVKSPLPLIKRYIIEKSAVFKREFLPLGLLIGNHEAMASVATFLQGMVKHKRTHLRNLLLTNTRQEQQAKEPGPVPRLMELLVLID
ncbi:hypothetical protein PCANC_19365 [Puccinia coronata f. sp. avenae]|uniref:Uncharacterized protein n=1 Tax=Puccinia coronata f. sp. avenae TaxID=200324 RepID=A0A2N5UPE9_9BASI|nr:hypothetical protein PCANC_19365 [Puccinia coronata f. sp. avenae]